MSILRALTLAAVLLATTGLAPAQALAKIKVVATLAEIFCPPDMRIHDDVPPDPDLSR